MRVFSFSIEEKVGLQKVRNHPLERKTKTAEPSEFPHNGNGWSMRCDGARGKNDADDDDDEVDDGDADTRFF